MSKALLTKLLGTTPVSAFAASQYRKMPLVVLYHGITQSNERRGIQNYRGKHVSAESFERQLIWFKKHFTVVPLQEIESLAEKRTVSEKPLCAITFDDGYRNNYEAAYPLLKKHSLPATIFITSGFIDREIALWPDILEEAISSIPRTSFTIEWNEGKETYPSRTREEKIASDMKIRDRLKKMHSRERDKFLATLMVEANITKEQVLSRYDYAPLTWENMKEMEQNGIRFGAHTKTHPILSRLSKEEQKAEIAESVEKLKSHHISSLHFAYPNGQPGDFNPDTEQVLKELGFSCAWTTGGMRLDTIHDNLFELPRVTLDNTEDFGRFRALASNAIPYIKKLIKSSPHDRPTGKSN